MRILNSLIVPKNVKGWGPLGFFSIHSVAKYQKKTEIGDPLVSPGTVLYVKLRLPVGSFFFC